MVSAIFKLLIFFIPFVIETLSNKRTTAIPLILLTIILIYLYTGSRQDGILFLGISLVSSAPIIIREIFNMKYLSQLKENRKYYRLVWTTSIFVIFSEFGVRSNHIHQNRIQLGDSQKCNVGVFSEARR
jgi:hypothetical protein